MNARAKKIVYDAWQITNTQKHLLKFGFWPSLFSIIVSGVYIFYQFEAFRHSRLFAPEGKDHINFSAIFNYVLGFIQSNAEFSIAFVVLAIVILIAYFFVPIICSGALVHLISKIYHGEKPKHGLSTGIFRFLPLFEINAVKGTMKPFAFFTEWSFVIRNIGPGYAWLLTPVLIFFSILGACLLFIFTFTTQFIVLEKAEFAGAIKNSTKMVIKNIFTTFSLFLIFILIELRVLLNIGVILFIPVIIIWITGLFGTLLQLQTTGIFIAATVVFLLIITTAYITGTLFVFGHAIWTLAYLEFQREEQEEEGAPEQLIEKTEEATETAEN